jgi:hypothetical protein
MGRSSVTTFQRRPRLLLSTTMAGPMVVVLRLRNAHLRHDVFERP